MCKTLLKPLRLEPKIQRAKAAKQSFVQENRFLKIFPGRIHGAEFAAFLNTEAILNFFSVQVLKEIGVMQNK